MKTTLLYSVLFSVMLVFFTSVSFAGFFGHHKKVTADVNGEIIIPIRSINDGKAHYFVYKDKGQEVKFFVLKSNDGIIRAAFDACDVCYESKKGYTQDGDFMICNNCGRRFHSSMINRVEGGCNPAPLDRIERGENLVITVKNILHGGRYF
jgi:uncharacterized membrane protein